MSLLVSAVVGQLELIVYGLLSTTHFAAAIVARIEGHWKMMGCYAASALLYSVICVAHLAH